MRVLPSLLFASLVVFTAPLAAAQQASTTGAATALFDQAVKLMGDGKFSEACPKLARSNELSPNGGTLFALAECYERNGQTASAWVTYSEAAIRARAAGRADAEKKATEAATRLEPTVSKLAISVPATSDIAGLAVTLDGRPVTRAEWGTGTPIDPGPHKIEATAPGRLPATQTVRFDFKATQKAIRIAVLEIAPRVSPVRWRPRGGAPRE